MIEIILSFFILLVVIVAMSIGILSGRQGLQGSCGGLNKISGIKSDCDGQCRRTCRKKKRKIQVKLPEQENYNGFHVS